MLWNDLCLFFRLICLFCIQVQLKITSEIPLTNMFGVYKDNASVIIISTLCFQPQLHIRFRPLLSLKHTLVCDICLLGFASILMTNLTLKTHCWGQQKKGVLGALSYWTKMGNTTTDFEHLSPAGSGDEVSLRPRLFHSYPAVSDGQLHSQQNHSCPFCSHSHTVHTHAALDALYCCVQTHRCVVWTVASTVQTNHMNTHKVKQAGTWHTGVDNFNKLKVRHSEWINTTVSS